MTRFIKKDEFLMANLAEHQNNDFFKFYYAAATESKEDLHFDDEEYAHLLKIVRKEIPAKEYFTDDYEIYNGPDDYYYLDIKCIEYKGETVLSFNDRLIDEDRQEYVPDDDLEMTVCKIYSRGKAVISPDIIIGEKLDLDTVKKVFSAFIKCDVQVVNGYFYKPVIRVRTCDYSLYLRCRDGKLAAAEIIREGLR